jgi:hypothetical protein
MKLAIAWVLFGLPLGAAIFAGMGLCRCWSEERHRITKVSAILLAISATLLACGATAYVQLVRPLPAFDYSVEELGLLLSFLGTVFGLITLRFPRWFSSLALGVSAWMFVLFFLLGSTY